MVVDEKLISDARFVCESTTRLILLIDLSSRSFVSIVIKLLLCGPSLF